MHSGHEDSPKRKRKKRRRHHREDIFDIQGVRKIILSELTQKIIECVVGEHVSSESPWKYVKKELVQDNLELHEDSSEFLPLRKEILAYPRDQILIGYIADETEDREDEFYICVTAEATDTIQKIIERMQQEQEYRLHYQLYKDCRPWHSFGTEEEVDEAIVKNTRPLLEVELETQYPIFPGKVQFRILKAEQRRDGYMELKCLPEENIVNVYMRRIDSYIQVAPKVISTEAQTVCTYPKNSATQYQYEVGKTDNLLLQCQSKIIRYANENLESLSDLLKVNGTINLYANDYDSLVKDPFTRIGWSLAKEFVEYMFFLDVNLCKGKMISDVYWHQMWTGTIAIAYSNIAPNIFYSGPNKEDEVYKAVHEAHLVLIWCFNDGLRPKLILESPREVNRVSFCKFDENLLVGGCKNGQIIIWDIRNKLQKVEEKEVLSIPQQKYRNYMHSLMGWMKNTHDISVVRPAAISELRFSHKAAVTGINWMNPQHEFSRTGNLTLIDKDDEERKDKYSLQFITSSLDGTVMIWDLKKKPTITVGSYKAKKLKRLKKRPSALEVDVSPYRIFHLNLKPIYKINVTRPNNKTRPIAITRCSAAYCWLKYEEVNPQDKSKKYDIKERIIFKPVMDSSKNMRHISSSMRIGTAEGDFAEIHWEGQDFDSGETVNAEQAKYTFSSKYHDGPINSIHTSRTNMATLTVGGKIFCLWRKELPNRPVLWRRSRQMFTKGEWSFFESYKIVLHSLSGITQKWILSAQSKSPFFQQVMSNGFLTSSGIHPFAQEKKVYGIGDEQGAFRLFFLPPSTTLGANTADEAANMDSYITREVNRKKLFYKWQEEFNKRNESYLQKVKDEATQRAKEEAEREAHKQDEKLPEKVDRKGPQPGKYVEWVKEQRQITEQARIKAMIINKKQLDTKELEKRRKPLQKLDEENERKKRKQKDRLKQGESIFQETVASLFPDVIKEKPIPPHDPYEGGDPLDEKRRCYADYMEAVQKSEDFIIKNPFKYEFSFKNLLVESRNKDTDAHHPHIKRYDGEKKLRRGSYSSETEEPEMELKGRLRQEQETVNEEKSKEEIHEGSVEKIQEDLEQPENVT